jgi:ABC-2 type transport system permease protein
MSVKRITAIFVKELQDLRTNWSQLLMYVFPIAITLIYSKLIPSDQMPNGTALIFGLVVLVTMAGILIPAMMIAEEKEKRTLEVLLLSPAKPAEIFLGKSLTTFLSIIACMFILMLIDNRNWNNTPVILAATGLASVFCIIFGLITGIFSKNQMSTGIVSTPLIFLFLMLPTFAVLGIKQLEGISKIVPIYYYIDLMKKVVVDGINVVSDVLFGFAMLAGGIAIASLILLIVYKKKGFE